MIPNQLFHYTTREIAIGKILGEGKIRLGLFGKTNDPRETKEWNYPIGKNIFDGSVHNDASPSTFKVVKVNVMRSLYANYYVNIIKQNEWKILCFSQNHPDYDESEKSNEFFAGYSLSRMWAQYAGNHTGICLEFNGKKLGENILKTIDETHKVFCGAVNYQNPESAINPFMDAEMVKTGTVDGIRQFCIEEYKALFLSKSKEWESEHEYRWLVHSKDSEPIYVPIDGAIQSVIIGVDFPIGDDDDPELYSLCRKYRIPAHMIRWGNGLPRLEKGEFYTP